MRTKNVGGTSEERRCPTEKAMALMTDATMVESPNQEDVESDQDQEDTTKDNISTLEPEPWRRSG